MIKKVILSLGLVAGLAYAAQAQGIRYGVKAGASLTNFTGSGVNADYKFGFHGGLMADFGLSDAFSIHPELLYAMKGAKLKDSDLKQNMHYLDVPVLARVKAENFFFEAGPQVSVLVAANGPVTTVQINGQNVTTSTTQQDNKANFNAVDFSYVAGLGYQLPSGPGIGLRYSGGFTDVVNNNPGGNVAHNGGFQLYLSYLFGGK